MDANINFKYIQLQKARNSDNLYYNPLTDELATLEDLRERVRVHEIRREDVSDDPDLPIFGDIGMMKHILLPKLLKYEKQLEIRADNMGLKVALMPDILTLLIINGGLKGYDLLSLCFVNKDFDKLCTRIQKRIFTRLILRDYPSFEINKGNERQQYARLLEGRSIHSYTQFLGKIPLGEEHNFFIDTVVNVKTSVILGLTLDGRILSRELPDKIDSTRSTLFRNVDGTGQLWLEAIDISPLPQDLEAKYIGFLEATLANLYIIDRKRDFYMIDLDRNRERDIIEIFDLLANYKWIKKLESVEPIQTKNSQNHTSYFNIKGKLTHVYFRRGKLITEIVMAVPGKSIISNFHDRKSRYITFQNQSPMWMGRAGIIEKELQELDGLKDYNLGEDRDPLLVHGNDVYLGRNELAAFDSSIKDVTWNRISQDIFILLTNGQLYSYRYNDEVGFFDELILIDTEVSDIQPFGTYYKYSTF